MRMSKLEKKFVNSMKQAEKNIAIAERFFGQIDLSKVKKVLEVGCGIGVLTSYLAKKYQWDMTGIDLDPEQINRAKKDYGENRNLRFIEADATKTPFDTNEFDLVLSFDVLHHIPDWHKVFGEIDRVLKKGCYYILNDLAFPNIASKTFRKLLSNYMGAYSMVDIVDSLRENHFKIVYEERPKINIFMRHFRVASQKSP
jgi:tocopherol O-methyltransferase